PHPTRRVMHAAGRVVSCPGHRGRFSEGVPGNLWIMTPGGPATIRTASRAQSRSERTIGAPLSRRDSGLGQKTITRTVARARLAALAALLLVAAFGLDAHAQSAVEQAITPNTTLRASLVSLSSMEVVRFSNDAQVSHGVITLLVEDHR